QHKEKVAKRQASMKKQAAKDARLAELEAWYTEHQNNTVSTRLEVEMPGLTKEEMKRRTDVAVEEATAKLQQRIQELEVQLTQQDRPAKVEQVEVDPKKDLSLEAMMTPAGMRKVADMLVKVAYQVESLTSQVASKDGVIDVLKANVVELEAKVAQPTTSCNCHFCQGHGDECLCGCGADEPQPEVAAVVVTMSEGEELIEPQTPVTDEVTDFVNETLRELGMTELIQE